MNYTEKYNKQKSIVKTGLLLVILFGIIFAGNALFYWTVIDYQYKNQVHSHMENAYYAADPATMRTELLLSIEGMRNLNLKPEMYDAILPWYKTPERQMRWQYIHIESVLTRINEFEDWKMSQTGTGSQQMKDVYTEKLDNIRHFIKDDGGWSDWIAEGTYHVNNYLFNVVVSWVSSLGLLLSLLSIPARLSVIECVDDRRLDIGIR